MQKRQTPPPSPALNPAAASVSMLMLTTSSPPASRARMVACMLAFHGQLSTLASFRSDVSQPCRFSPHEWSPLNAADCFMTTQVEIMLQ